METEKKKIVLAVIMVCSMILLHGCKKNEESEITNVQTTLLNVEINAVTFSGNVSFKGSIIDMGFCWSLENIPTVDDFKISHGANTNQTGIENYESEITDFIHNTKYFVRAYATNNEGTVYGNEEIFVIDIKPGEEIKDVDGNNYKTAIIGTQGWMAENLRVTHFANGNTLYYVSDPKEWFSKFTSPLYGVYNNDPDNIEIYGLLYNPGALNGGILCPEGWRIPIVEDWEKLAMFLNGSDRAGGYVKEAGTSHWMNPNIGANNISGFNAIGAGIRTLNGYYDELGIYSKWWTKLQFGYYSYTAVYHRNSSMIISSGRENYNRGYSIRCIKD